MKNNRILLIATLLFFVYHGNGQSGRQSVGLSTPQQADQSTPQPICGFDIVHQKAMKTNAVYRQHVLEGESAIRLYIQRHPALFQKNVPRTILSENPDSRPPSSSASPAPFSNNPAPSSNSAALSSNGAVPLSEKPAAAPSSPGTLYTIPVVVHIINTGGAIGSIYNPTDAQIQGAIDYLNSVYNGSYPGTQGAGDLQIQFVLARRDPSCNPTTGIVRIDGSAVPGYVTGGVNANTSLGASEINVKNLDRWDPSSYYNVWVVDKIDGNDGTSGQFIAGYAYFPGSPTDVDGIVMLATQMIAGQKTLPHEIGHAFNLYHPFEGSANSSECPVNTNCSLDGDMVCDTDPISYDASATGVVDFTCRNGTNLCTNTAFSINTESNYMNYTNCYTLFTPGQKTRMLAAAAGIYRVGLSTSAGIYAPSEGASPCVPKINFSEAGDQVTETTAATSGCRSYKDYTYSMSIGNSPTADATVTINPNGGNATPGIDFDLTTNGSFTSPSFSLRFPAGSLSPQTFTIRVYDDASVNGTRTAILHFTVDNGGGNAVAGDGIPTFSLTIHDNDSPPTAGTVNGAAALGTTTYNFVNAVLVDTMASQRSQVLYKASELTAAGVPAGPLTGISMNILTKTSTRPYGNFRISIGTSTANYLVDNNVLTLGTNMMVVKNLFSWSTTTGWNSLAFDTPFIWDGTSNIVVEICYDNGVALSTAGADAFAWYSDGGSSVQGNTIVQDNINCSQSFTSLRYYSGGKKPEMNFLYGIPPTVIDATLNSSAEEYLGPNADIYFYDHANQQLLAEIKNGSNFNYGCTQIDIDRAGPGAAAFWTNNPSNFLMNKTFKVIPATNNPSGAYTITLFYTSQEVNSWQSATGQSINNIQLIKVSGRISDVTPALPAAGGSMIIANPSVGNLGANTTLTYSFSNGFSGFGAGIPGFNPLPLTLLNFNGNLQDGRVALQWTTSDESGSKQFGIERSYDGAGFVNIGFVDATGTPSPYHFLDPDAAHPLNFYRLREVDQDGQSTYSRTIQVNGIPQNGLYAIQPNPFQSSLRITFGQIPSGPIGIRLLDVTGKELKRIQAQASSGSSLQLDLADLTLSSGIYLLELNLDSKIYMEKLLREP